jgi:hypothetical protein
MKVTRIAAAVLTALALPAAQPAAASDGTFTYMLCANPDNGRGTSPQDGAFPDGVSMNAGHPNMTTLQSIQRCSGNVTPGRGMRIEPQGAYHLNQQQGTSFKFEAPPELRFLDAEVWSTAVNDAGMMTAFVRSADDWIYASPNWGRCEDPGWGCKRRGTDAAAFLSANYTAVGRAHDRMERGFKWFLKCAWFGCEVSNAQFFAVYGAKVNLADDSAPSAALGVGGLRDDAVLRGTERVSFTGHDGQSGIYRARFIVDDQPRPWFAVDGGDSSCRDVNPANGDDYEFGRTRPCASSVNGVAELNTTALTDGRHNVRLLLEDASGRQASVLDRDVAVDNVDPPTATDAPAIDGYAKDGEELSAVPAMWDDHGAAGDPVVTSRWERCDGGSCVELPGSASTPLVLDEADVGKRIRIVETAVNGEGSTTVRSAFTEPVLDTPAPSSVSAPGVSGNPRRGNLLVASDGVWDDHGSVEETVTSRQWQRCRYTGADCVDVPGATGLTYELGDADLNRRLRVIETATNDEGSGSAASAATARVTREDGTLPPDNNGEDDDGDGEIDEGGEDGGSGGGSGGTGTSGASGTPGAPGAPGAPGVSSTTTASSVKVSRSTTILSPNGSGASASARLVVGWRDARGTALTVGYGKGAVVSGRLVDEAGRGIGGAVVEVSAVTSMRGAVAAARPSVTTGEDGRFSYSVDRRASSETIRFSYAHERGGKPAAIDELELRVIAAVRLAVKLRGVAVSYKGTVVSGPMPRGGKLVIIQGRVKGKAWQTFASRRARAGGRFSGKYRLKLRVPGRKLQFRARVVAESGFPYLATVSRAVTKTVR